jgi:tetratricopeptide (TPR) repeat protein
MSLERQSSVVSQAVEATARLYQAGKLAEARRLCGEALQVAPDDVRLLQLHGLVAYGLGDSLLAIESLEKAVRIDPSDCVLVNNLGEAYRGANRPSDAESCYRRASELKPEYADAHYNLARLLHALGESTRAALSYDRHGSALQQMGKLEEAIGSYRLAIALKPDFANAYYNMAIASQRLTRLPEAIKAFSRALELKPDFAEAHINLGNAQKSLGHLRDAEQSYSAALALKPGDPVASYNLSTLRLSQGDYRAGLELYESRFEVDPDNAARYKFMLAQVKGAPLWQGGQLGQRTLLLWQEQGAGDFIMMMRYLPGLKALGAGRLIVCCDASLVRLSESIPGVDEVWRKDRPPESDAFDCYCPSMSLPRFFDTQIDTIPSSPYLHVPDAIQRAWASKLAGIGPARVGLVWAGGNSFTDAALRSIRLELLAPVLGVGGVDFFSLQKGEGSAEIPAARGRLLPWIEECGDFLDTAALIDQLDLVISVDTSVAHLAGALGKPVWLLSRFESDWRWMLDREDSPWYPTMRIFRQSGNRDWSEVVTRVASTLRSCVEAGSFRENRDRGV